MGRKGVISSHATLYSRTERKGATQIAARSTTPISWETPPPSSAPPPLPRTLCERTVLSTCWSVREGGSWGSLYKTHPWLFTLFSIKPYQEKVWDADGNWRWHFLISSIFWHTESHLNWKNGSSYTLHQAILVQFGRNRDYETVCWETTHPDKLYNFWFTAIRSCESNPADSLFYQHMVSIFRSLWQR